MGAADRYEDTARLEEREAFAAMPFWDRFWYRAVRFFVMSFLLALMFVLGGGVGLVLWLFS